MLGYIRAALFSAGVLAAAASSAFAQHTEHPPGAMPAPAPHPMWSAELGRGWRLLGMAQAYPIVTFGAPGEDASALDETEFYVTQPAIMTNIESPGSRLTLRTTLNFEGLTQEDGELTFGGWGEGFIDKRHPHTLLHEAMLSVNVWDALGGALSISAGKGFAPFGTDDPMVRPGLEYPTNHHLSQILERWTVNAAYLRGGWSIEAGVFGGAEPEDPYDFGNIESFGDSWSARVAHRWGVTSDAAPEHAMGPAAWEVSLSYAHVAGAHDAAGDATRLYNVALRHESAPAFGALYALAEYSRREPDHGAGFFSVLAEAQATLGRHQPYARIEWATRPEYPRLGPAGTDGFFRYDHDAHVLGATEWLIASLGYNFLATRGTVGIRPFVDAQLHRVRLDRGPAALEPDALFGVDTFWSVSFGLRLFFGGEPMRMGAYGVLDPMTSMNRMDSGAAMEMETGRASRARLNGALR